jgi:hypothetical protein
MDTTQRDSNSSSLAACRWVRHSQQRPISRNWLSAHACCELLTLRSLLCFACAGVPVLLVATKGDELVRAPYSADASAAAAAGASASGDLFQVQQLFTDEHVVRTVQRIAKQTGLAVGQVRLHTHTHTHMHTRERRQ